MTRELLRACLAFGSQFIKKIKQKGIVGTHRMAAQDGSSSTTKTNATGSQSCMIKIPFMVEDKTLYTNPYKTICMW